MNKRTAALTTKNIEIVLDPHNPRFKQILVPNKLAQHVACHDFTWYLGVGNRLCIKINSLTKILFFPYCLGSSFKEWNKIMLKGSYDAFLKIIIWCIWCNRICWHALMFKKHIIFQILYIIVGPLCPTSLKRFVFYKVPHSDKHSLLWLANWHSALWLAEQHKHS